MGKSDTVIISIVFEIVTVDVFELELELLLLCD